MKDICRAGPLALLFGLSLLLASCAGEGSSSSGSFGGTLRGKEKLAFSAVYEQSAKLRQMAPLHERGVEELVVIYRPRDKVGIRGYGRFAYVTRSSEVDDAVLIPDGYVEERLLADAAGAAVRIRLATAQEATLADHMTPHLFSGMHKIDETGQEILAAMKAAGVDAVLVAEEPETVVNIFSQGGVVGALSAKGLTYKPGWGAYVYAAIRFFLIDTASGKEVVHSGFTQVSAERSRFPWQHFFDLYPPGQQQVIRTILRDRLANNAKVMLQLVKVIPGDDGAYLTYDPSEDSDANRAYAK